MKTRYTIYLVFAILFTVLDLLITLARLKDLRSHFSTDAYDIGYLLGSQILLCIGLIFFNSANNVKKKIKNKDDQNLIDNINQMGNS